MEQTLVVEQPIEDSSLELKELELEADVDEEIYADSWGDELYMLVHSNQDVIVTCPWMDNAEVTLGDAMTTYEYPPGLTAEDEPFLISVVNELLASRVVDEDEPEDLVVEIEEDPVLDENEVEQSEEPDLKEGDSQVSAKGMGPSETKKSRTVQPVAQARQPEKAATRPKEVLQPKVSEATSTAVTKKPAANVSTEQVSISRPRDTEDKSDAGPKEVKIKPPKDALEATKVEPEVAIRPERDLILEPGMPQVELDDETLDPPAQLLTPIFEASAEPESSQALEIEHLTALAEEAALPIDMPVDEDENQTALASTDNRLGSDETEDSGEEEVITDHMTMSDPELVDDHADLTEHRAVVEDNEPSLPTDVEGVSAEPPEDLDVVVEQILAEHTKQANPQTIEVTHRYLNKIVEVAAEVRAFDDEDGVEESKAVEKLEELFIELCDEMGVLHTPELIESLVCQTLEQRVTKNKYLEEEADDTQQRGLSTTVRKPSVGGHATLNDAIVHNRLISKIALELCGFKVSLSLN